MEKVLLTSGDVCRIAGVPLNTLDRWVSAGLLGPANAKMGSGRHRVYSLMEVLGVAAGARYRAEGAGDDRVAGVVRFLSGYSLERLEADFRQGRTFPVPAALLREAARVEGVSLPDAWIPGKMDEPPPQSELSPRIADAMLRLDLPTIKKEVERKVAELASRRPRGRKPGRKAPVKARTKK